MKQRTYRGNIDPRGLIDALMARFDHGNLMAQITEEGAELTGMSPYIRQLVLENCEEGRA